MKKLLSAILASAMVLTFFTSCVSGVVAGVLSPAVAAAVVSGIIGIGDPPTEEEKAKNKQDAVESLKKIEEKEGATVTLNDSGSGGKTKDIYGSKDADSAQDEFLPPAEPVTVASDGTSGSGANSGGAADNSGAGDYAGNAYDNSYNDGSTANGGSGSGGYGDSGGAVSVSQTPVESAGSSLSAIELILAGKTEEAKAALLALGDMNVTDGAGLSSLHAAAMTNNAELVTWLLARGADPEILNDAGDTPLFTAINYDSVEAAQALVDGGASIFATNAAGKAAFIAGIERGKHFYRVFVVPAIGEVRDMRGQTIVHYFTRREDIEGMALCIERDLPLDIRDNNGLTPLALAYENNESTISAALAAALILAGVSPIRGEWAYFENTVMTRNARQTFEDDQSPLHLAVVANHYGIFTYLIACGALLDARDISGATPLHIAVRYGRTQMAADLIEAGADVNACDSTLKTPLLITAPAEAQNEIYTLLLQNGAEASVQDIFGDNALHIATMGNMQTVLLTKLINAGAQINAQNKKGLTPLAQAVDQKNIEHIQLYVSFGADIFAADPANNTPLTRCLRDGNILKILVNRANIAVTDSYGNTPLHIALENKATAGSVRYLLDAGINVNALNCYGETPVFSAMKADNYQGVQQLIKAGAETDLQDNQGNTAVHAAVRWAAEKSLAKLISAGYSVNVKNQSGKTPLAESARYNRINMMKKLISSGADVNAADVTGRSALMDAVECKNPVAASLLLQKGANAAQRDVYGRNALHEAATSGSVELIELIAAAGVNPLSNDVHGRTPFGIVCRGSEQAIRAALGTNPGARDAAGNTALHIAVIEKAPYSVFELLLGMGYSINAQNNAGRTAVQLAVSSGLNEEVQLLLSRGADIFVLDNGGDNAVTSAFNDNPSVLTDMCRYFGRASDSAGNGILHYAAVYAEADVIRVLADYGASKTLRNISNETPADVALRCGRSQDVVDALR